ncbi:hypothetical protein J0910_31000 [Nocardiopsis sp. CNT-189]|uniref:hypothetical protein n=1 Tax=Nocardiopsis oceanisediminis TaxID=2816862 RepID=UPI003B2B110F
MAARGRGEAMAAREAAAKSGKMEPNWRFVKAVNSRAAELEKEAAAGADGQGTLL